MNANDQLQDLPTDNRNEPQREIIRQCLNEIVVEIGNLLCEAGLNSPIFLTVPNSGDAIVTMATALDPSDDEWSHVAEIVREIVSQRLSGLKLRSREMICAMANAQMGAVDVTAD